MYSASVLLLNILAACTVIIAGPERQPERSFWRGCPAGNIHSQKLNFYQPVNLPAKVSPPFQGWGKNVFITCYKNIQGWLNCST